MPKGLNTITETDKTIVIAAFSRWQANRTKINRSDLTLLFKKYHEYVHQYPKDIDCGSCIQFIFNFWKKTTDTWQNTP